MQRFLNTSQSTKTSGKKKQEKLKSPLLTEEYKIKICEVSYLGKRGYTIPKSELIKEDIAFLKQDLFLKPEIPGAVNYGGANQEAAAFPVYRESDKKMYIPRFYGVERYGHPIRSEIEPGLDIHVEFVKPLRDYQEQIVQTYLASVCGEKPSGGILQIFTGAGKCLGRDTPILMYDGTIKLVQDVIVGDQLMGDDSTPRTVLTLARGREMMYKVKPKRGDGYIVNESHILSLKYNIKMNKNIPKNTILDISVRDYLNLPKSYNSITYCGRLLSGYRVPIIFEEKPVEIDPYLFGYWLGDGHHDKTAISTQESTVIKYIVDCFKTKHTSLYLRYTGDQYDYRINSIKKTKANSNIFLNFLKKYNVFKNKHIPHHYKCNSRKIQLELLAGIIDSDGYYKSNCYEIIQKNEKLLDDIVYLCRSLGFAAYKNKLTKKCYNTKVNGVIAPKEGTYYTTYISGIRLDEIPVKCPRKKAGQRISPQDVLKYSFDLEKLGIDDYYGFEIDGNRRFVLGDFTVTHNTVMALKIAACLNKKTLILVHKEFLMNQWIERITEYLPTARVGRIQGPTLDIDDKDIVIGMIQTLYNRTYSQEVYSQFGLLICDEVHHIASEQFSKTLLKCICPYTLGISATVQRKDKLTKLLHMFLGPLIYSMDRKKDDIVSVYGIEYRTGDAEFNEVELDYMGKPKYSTMISKICDYIPRQQFILRIIQDLVIKNQGAQMIILGHNRSLLTALYEGVISRGFASCGYYLGGMKQKDLKESEDKTVIVSTYAMAAEALDIPNLSILVMVTSKTDIVQSVGRILRKKHDNPLIVDIVDSHSIFQNQWTRRKTYYRKCNYRIRYTNSHQYDGTFDGGNWIKVYDPKAGAVIGDFSEKTNTNSDEDTENDKMEEKGTTIFNGKCMIEF